MICVGLRELAASNSTSERVDRTTKSMRFKVVNLVATADLNERIDLGKTALPDGFSSDSAKNKG